MYRVLKPQWLTGMSPADHRSAISRAGGVARARKLTKRQLREIGRKAYSSGIALATPEQRRAWASLGAKATNLQRWGS